MTKVREEAQHVLATEPTQDVNLMLEAEVPLQWASRRVCHSNFWFLFCFKDDFFFLSSHTNCSRQVRLNSRSTYRK